MPSEHVFNVLNQGRNEIRLLHIDQTRRSSNSPFPTLTGRLECVSLSDTPKYNALSYVWGNPIAASAVFLDDGSYVPVAANLLDALLHVSIVEPAPPPVWVDALCINQADDTEKSWQVQIMDQIYLRAAKTLVYLGPSTKDSYEALRAFSVYGRKALQYGILELSSGSSATDPFEFGYERWTLGPLDPYGERIVNKIIRNMQDPGKPSPLRMLASIMQRPWWSRIWVLQELLLSPNPVFICGYQTISAREFVASVRLYEAALTVYYEDLLSKPTDPSTRDKDLSLIHKIGHETRSLHNIADVPALVLYTTQLRQRERSKYHGIEEPYFGLGNLWDLVQDINLSSRRLDASDPRDRIYALIGIARLSRVDAITLQPDYGLTCADVYAQATYIFLQYTGARLLILAVHSHKRGTVPGLPSWAVDWSLTNLIISPFPVLDDPYQEFHELVRDTCNKNILTTSVTVYGGIETIELKAPTLETRTAEDQHLDIIMRLSAYQSDLAMYKRTSSKHLQNPLEDLICAMILNSASNSSSVENSEYAPSELHKAVVLIQNEVFNTQSCDFQASEGTEDATATAFISSWPNLNSSTISDTSEPGTSDSSLATETLSYALSCIRDTIRQGAKLFIADGGLVGVGPQAIHSGDVLIGYEKDLLRFIIRSVKGGHYQLIGKAYVPRLNDQRATVTSSQTSIIKLC